MTTLWELEGRWYAKVYPGPSDDAYNLAFMAIFNKTGNTNIEKFSSTIYREAE